MKLKRFSLMTTSLVFFYISGVVGCRYFPLLANGCIDDRLLFTLLYGLLYVLVIMTMIFMPLLAIVYIRVTIIMPISRAIYGDGNTLDERLFGWFDKGWSYCQRLLSILF